MFGTKIWIALAFTAGLAGCGSNAGQQVLAGGAVGAGAAAIGGGNLATGAAVGAAGNLLFCQTYPKKCK